MTRSRLYIWIHAGLLTTVLLPLAWLSLSSLTFFTNDTGLRLLQVLELVDNRWQTFAVSYPGRFLDPELQHVPFYYAYVVLGEDIFLKISALFPLLASLLYAVTGRLGLIILPVLGTVMSALAVTLLARLARLTFPVHALWISPIGTPLLFYSLELWDHSFVTAFAIWAVYFLARGLVDSDGRSILVSGGLAAVAWSQRPEFAFLTTALGISLLVFASERLQSALQFAAGNVAVATPLAIANNIWFGNPLGIMYASRFFDYGVPQEYAYMPYSDGPPLTRSFHVGRMLTYIESRDPVTFGATLLGLVAILLIVFALRVPRWRRRSVLLAGFVVAALSYALWLAPMSHIAVTGILPTFPLLAFSLAIVEEEGEASPPRRVYHVVSVATLLFLASMLLVFPSFGGTQWGSRYFLPAYPLLAFMAVYAYEKYRQRFETTLQFSLRLLFFGLVAASVIVQLAGVRVLLRTHRRQAVLREGLRDLPADVILTNSPFLPSQMSSLREKTFLYLDSTEDFDAVVPRMMAEGIDRIAVVPVEGIPLAVPNAVDNFRLEETEPLVFRLVEKR